MRWMRKTTIGVALAAALATTACPGDADEPEPSPLRESGTGSTGVTGGAVTGELTGPVGSTGEG